MTTTGLPGAIRASIHPDAILRVRSFFNASLSDVLNEVLQNSRRSGATRANIDWDGETLTIADDGQGISNPQTLLSFGESGWSSKSAQDENPAGMGFYALARSRNVTVRSKHAGAPPWEVRLTQEHFTGEAEAPVNRLSPGAAIPAGTAISIDCADDPGNHVADAARHHPLYVYYNGSLAGREDFLREAVHVRHWNGVRIGVFRQEWRSPASRDLNFHGITVASAKMPHVDGLHFHWKAGVDVADAKELELTLPARKELVENRYAQDLRTACLEALYQEIAKPEHGEEVTRAQQEEARAMGVRIPDSQPKLLAWRPLTADGYGEGSQYGGREREELPEDAVVMEIRPETADGQTLARAAAGAGILPRLVARDRRMEGFAWYDALPKATGLTISVAYGNRVFNLNERRDNPGSADLPEGVRPDAIEFTLETKDASGAAGSIRMKGDVAFELDDIMYWDEAVPLVTRDADISVDDLTELMLDSWFSASDDKDADSYDTQRDHAGESYRNTAASLLMGNEEALIQAFSKIAWSEFAYRVPEGHTAIIRVGRQGPVEVTLERNAEEGVEQPD